MFRHLVCEFTRSGRIDKELFLMPHCTAAECVQIPYYATPVVTYVGTDCTSQIRSDARLICCSVLLCAVTVCQIAFTIYGQIVHIFVRSKWVQVLTSVLITTAELKHISILFVFIVLLWICFPSTKIPHTKLIDCFPNSVYFNLCIEFV